MLSTKFQFIWESGFRGEDFLEINQSGFRGEDFLEINQSEKRMACGSHVCKRIGTK
jgi:hypothetical protein